ncbi:MAG: dihydroorotate dehydrogenase [Deltaproteobacteria bacterium]|nr:dihydroorotate dehydrogenase [Deltaproteobacteria bacterium]
MTTALDLSVRVGGVDFANPLLAASGCFGWGVEYSSIFPVRALGGFVTKGLSQKPRPGNAPPRIAETASGMLNSIGIESVGVDAFLAEKLPPLIGCGTRVIVNLFGETEDEYVEIAHRLRGATGIHALELNASCPNTAKGGLEFGIVPDVLRSLTRRVRDANPLPLYVKLTPNVTDITASARAALEAGADAVTAINTLRGIVLSAESRRAVLSTRFGGLSGPAIKPIALAMVHQIRRALPIPIIGCGGITSARDVVEFILAGASAVQIGTALFANPLAAQEILVELPVLCARLGITRLADQIGAAAL